VRYNPKSIANYFLALAQRDGTQIDPMKLQKLMYYAHGWFAGHTGEPLINEAVEAWPYGPVVPSLYHEFKRFGSGNICGWATEYAGGTLQPVPIPHDEGLRSFLDNVWKSYGQFTGVRLSEMTHAPGGPWDVARRQSGNLRGADIPFDVIRAHFGEAVRNASRGPA